MAVNRKILKATPEKIFELLLDPHEYPRWVVGAQKIRAVDAGWPAIGAAFHHSSGVAGEVEDKTEILELDSPNRIVLRAHARPFGIARIEIDVVEDGAGSVLRLREYPEPGTRMAVLASVLGMLLFARNIEALRRMRRRLEARAEGAASS